MAIGFARQGCNSPSSPILDDELHPCHPNPRYGPKRRPIYQLNPESRIWPGRGFRSRSSGKRAETPSRPEPMASNKKTSRKRDGGERADELQRRAHRLRVYLSAAAINVGFTGAGRWVSASQRARMSSTSPPKLNRAISSPRAVTSFARSLAVASASTPPSSPMTTP